MDRTKYATLRLTKTPTDGTGMFTAVVSTFGGAPDADGDIIAPGAYDQTIADWMTKGALPTLWWMHGYEDPLNAIGKLTDIRVEGDDLVVDGKLDLTNTRAQTVYEGMLTDKFNEFSIGYAVRAEQKVNGSNLITDLELLEVSVVFAGANRNTRIVSIKSLMEAGEFAKAQALAGKPSAPLRKDILEHYAEEYPDLAIALMRSSKGEEMTTKATEQDTITCPSCDAMNATDAVYCDQCGKALGDAAGGATYSAGADETAACPMCGEMNATDAKFCDQCGADMGASPKSGTVTVKVNLEPALVKAGRVIGSKAATDLKAALTGAVDEFVSSVNGAGEMPPPAEKNSSNQSGGTFGRPAYKAWLAPEGSMEDIQEDLGEAIDAWYDATYPSAPGETDDDWDCDWQIVGTYRDYVVVQVDDDSVTDGEDELYFKLPYTIADDGSITIGTAEPVTVEVTVAPKVAPVETGPVAELKARMEALGLEA